MKGRAEGMKNDSFDLQRSIPAVDKCCTPRLLLSKNEK
jgi:hypothetical protein